MTMLAALLREGRREGEMGEVESGKIMFEHWLSQLGVRMVCIGRPVMSDLKNWLLRRGQWFLKRP